MTKLKVQTEVAKTPNDDVPAILHGYLLKMDPESDLPLLPEDKEDVKRRRIWAEANASLRAAIVQIAEWFSNTYRLDILQRYRLGELIKNVKDDIHSRGRHYGSYAAEKLIDFFGIERGMLYSALRLVETYTREEIEELSRKCLRDGRPICYSHVRVLMTQ